MVAAFNMIYLTNGHVPSRWAFSHQICNMAREFARSMRDFELVTATSLSALLHRRAIRAALDGVRVHAIPVSVRSFADVKQLARYSRRAYMRLAFRYAERQAPDLIYTRSAVLASRLAESGQRVAFEIHEPMRDTVAQTSLLRNKSRVSLVCLSSLLLEELVEQGFASKQCLVEPSGVDMSREAGDPLRLRSRLCASDRKLVVYTGHLYDTKGIPLILQAAEQLPALQFALVGGWPADIKRVRGKIEATGLTNVSLAGFVPPADVAEYQAAADILVLPTSAESHLADYTSPLKLFEYCRSGRPIVAADLPNIRSTVADGQHCLLFAPDDLAGFVSRITQVAGSATLGTKLGKKAQELAENYSWQNRANRIITFLSRRVGELRDEDRPLL